jgi:hypothetical protein
LSLPSLSLSKEYFFQSFHLQHLKMAVISKFLVVTALFLSSLVSIAAAHPGEHHDNLEVIREIKARSIDFENQSRELQSACENNEEAEARKERAYARRAATVERLRRERGLQDGESNQRPLPVNCF